MKSKKPKVVRRKRPRFKGARHSPGRERAARKRLAAQGIRWLHIGGGTMIARIPGRIRFPCDDTYQNVVTGETVELRTTLDAHFNGLRGLHKVKSLRARRTSFTPGGLVVRAALMSLAIALVALEGCGGAAFDVGLNDAGAHAGDDAAAAGELGPEAGGPLEGGAVDSAGDVAEAASSLDAGRELDASDEEASSTDAAPPTETGPSCSTPNTPLSNPDNCGLPPYGDVVSYPGWYVVSNPGNGCEWMPSPPACDCSQTYDCACIAQALCPDGVTHPTGCTAGVPVVVICP